MAASGDGKKATGRHLDVAALESWLWETACTIRGPLDAPKFKDYILPLVFLKRLSDVAYGKSYFLSVAHKTTNLACINTTKLKALPVLLPQLDEQEKIVATLQAVDKKLEVETRKSLVLDATFQTLLHNLMTGRVRVNNLDTAAWDHTEAG